jgi:cystathionine beta-lyase
MNSNELSTILNQTGENRDQYQGSVSPPIFQTSNFCFPNMDVMRAALKNELSTPFYTRGFNPTAAVLREKLAALEGTEDALVLSSGSAAVACAVISQVKAGDHVLCVTKPYSWTNKLISQLLNRFGVEFTFADGKDADEFLQNIKPNTHLIYLESPNSLTFEQQDISAITQFAKNRNITTIIDNSYSSPLFQQPAKMGVDLIIHSATKYLNGHSDALGGVICGSKEKIQKIFANEWMTLGAHLSPHECSLVIRGLRTLDIRMERSAQSGLKVMQFLESHPKVEKVFHPFAEQYDQKELSKKQLKNVGGLFSFQVKAESLDRLDNMLNSFKHFLLATSWGGHESLIFPMAVLHHSANYSGNTLPWNLIRIYVGLESPELLIDDLKQALDQL